MRHSDQTLLFDSFMNVRQDQSSDVNDLNIFNSNSNNIINYNNNTNPNNTHTINNINVTNTKNNNNLINRNIASVTNSKMDNWLKEDIDIFQLYTKARQNLSHSNRILNLTWRLYKIRSKQNGTSGGDSGNNKVSLNDRYKVEDSFIFQDSSVFNQYDTNSEYLLLNRPKFDTINYNNGYSDDNNNNNNNNSNNNNNTLFNNIHAMNNTNSNYFIDNDNFTTRDNEFDMFIEDPPSSIHESLVTPLPMDIPQSLPNHMLHYPSSFNQDHMSSSFIFHHMTPSSLTPTPITSFAPTPSAPLTSTTTTVVFNDSTTLRNEEAVSVSLPKMNDILKQKRSGATATPTTKRRITARNNNGINNGNSSSTPTKCSNCGTHNTPLWRKDPQGNSLCNACGLFLKLHGVMRPLSLKTDTIKKRQRNTNSNNANNTNSTKKNYNVKKVVSKDKINLDWLNLNL